MSTADDVLALLMAGERQVDIARTLGYSPFSVGHIVQRLCHEHDAPTTAKLVARLWARRVADLEARLTRSQAALAGFERRSGVDRRSGD